jgi:hypothetical protein
LPKTIKNEKKKTLVLGAKQNQRNMHKAITLLVEKGHSVLGLVKMWRSCWNKNSN